VELHTVRSRDMVLNSIQGKIYVNYGLGDRGSIPVTRNILSSPSYPDSFLNSLWVLSSDYKGRVLWGCSGGT
jgi:hypothetical protein